MLCSKDIIAEINSEEDEKPVMVCACNDFKDFGKFKFPKVFEIIAYA